MRTQETVASRIQDAKKCFESWLKQNGLTAQSLVANAKSVSIKEEVDYLYLVAQNTDPDAPKHVSYTTPVAERVENFVSFISSMGSVEKKMIKCDEDLLTASIDDRVLPKLQELVEKDFSYLPIVDEDNVCVGVFSAYILMVYNSLGEVLSEKTTFKDIYDVLDEEEVLAHKNYVFKPVNSYIHQVYQEFKRTNTFHNDVVLLTRFGNENEPLLGMLTVWNV